MLPTKEKSPTGSMTQTKWKIKRVQILQSTLTILYHDETTTLNQQTHATKT